MPQLQCILVTPEKTVAERAAEFAVVTLLDGEMGIAPGHAPVIGRLDYGEMRIRQAQRTSRYYVEGGFVEVIDDVVSVLTARAIPAEELDEDAVREQLETALARRIDTPQLMAERDRAVRQCRAQLDVARRAK